METEASVTEAVVGETSAAVVVVKEPVITDTVKINKKPAATTAKKPKSEPVVIVDVQD